MAQRFQTPPNWPSAPEGWVPPEGWQPDPAWGPAPAGWDFWAADRLTPAFQPAQPSTAEPAEGEEKVSIFRARGRIRELSTEVAALRGQLDRLGALTVADLAAQAANLREELAQLRADLRTERDQHAAALAEQAADARGRAVQELVLGRW